MCRKLIYLVSVVLVLALASNALANLSGSFIGGPDQDTSDAVTATASADYGASTVPLFAVDGSGLDTADMHNSTYTNQMWEGPSGGGANPGTVTGDSWIRFEFDQSYELEEMWVWNSNQLNSPWSFGGTCGFNSVTIQYSTTGGTDTSDWTTLGSYTFTQAIGDGNDTAGLQEADFSSASAMYVVLTAHSNFGSASTWGLSEVRFYIPEPATVALLGMGGLALLRRKRKR